MKVCFVSEFFDPSYGGQYASIKSVMDMCKLKKIDFNIIYKKSKIYIDKNSLEKTIKKADIVHIFGGWTWFYIKTSLLAYKLNKKVILHPLGFYEPWSLSQKKIKKTSAWYIYQKNFLKKADLVHCASRIEELNLKKLIPELKTTILPFPVHKKFIKKKITQNINKRCIYFSRLHKKKGLDILIDAWVKLKKSDWSLDIVGYGNQNYYKNKIKDCKINNINFLKGVSKQNKKKELLDNYDFFILPSLNENFGIAILESLARGLPVLTTNETPWTVIQNKNAGWIINYSSIELILVLNKIFNATEKEFFKKKKKCY